MILRVGAKRGVSPRQEFYFLKVAIARMSFLKGDIAGMSFLKSEARPIIATTTETIAVNELISVMI